MKRCDFGASVEVWRSYVETALAFCDANPDRGMTVKNEDLARRPEYHFERILGFLAAASHPGPAEFLRTNKINSSFEGALRT